MGLPNVNRAESGLVGPREVELKLRLPPGSRAALEASSVFAAVKAKKLYQVTTYFDTPDSLLDRAGLTLRVRRSGNTRIQTVKARAKCLGVATSRGEWEWRIDQDLPDVGRLADTAELAKAARAIKGKLEPVFVTDIRRTVRVLHLAGDTIVEAAIDEGSIKAGLAHEPVSELELELKSGRIEAVYRLAAELHAIAPLWISPESKSARGWHLRSGQTEGAQKASTPELGPRMRAADGFHQIIDGTLGHLMANIGPTLRGDIEGVHQMRIALRGSRAALKLFERDLDAAAAGQFNAALLHFAQIFGTARDWDVFCLETLPAATTDLPTARLRDLNPVAEVQRQVAHAAVGDAVRGQDFTALLLGLAAWVEAGVAQPRTIGDDRMGMRLRTVAPSLLDRVAGKANKRGRHVARLSAEELHSLRKSLKKLCCDVGYLAGLYRRRSVNAYVGRCEDLLEMLGVANDAMVTQRLAPTLVTDSRPDLAKPAGALAKWSTRRGRKALQGLKGALRDFRATPAFWSQVSIVKP